MNDVKIDWSDAPEGATDFNTVNEMWYKEEAGVMWYWSMHRTCWVEGAERGEYSNEGDTLFISRPKEVKINDWN